MRVERDVFPALHPAVRLFGVPIASATQSQVLDLIHRSIISRRNLQIGVVNAAKLVAMRRDRLLRKDVMSSDIILADGSSILWASRLLRDPLPERVAGIDLMMGMLQRGAVRKYRFFLLGAAESVSRAVADKIRDDYPGAVVAGRRNGYFSAEEEPEIVRAIKESRSDILLIAMSSPKKERFLARWTHLVEVPVCHGVGGSFDVLAGKVKRAPHAWQRMGLEWFYRLKQEPRRLLKRYLLTNTLFCLMTVEEITRRLKSGFSLKSS